MCEIEGGSWGSHKTGETLSVLAWFWGYFIYVWYTFYMYFIEIEGLGVHTELRKS